MSDRFYASEPITGDTAVLSGDEAHHLAQVMRAKVGDEVMLFDGSGVEWFAAVPSDALRVVAHPMADGLTARPTDERGRGRESFSSAPVLSSLLAREKDSRPRSVGEVFAAIGPEGGFTPAEIAAAQA